VPEGRGGIYAPTARIVRRIDSLDEVEMMQVTLAAVVFLDVA
jgi:hypothetical protein